MFVALVDFSWLRCAWTDLPTVKHMDVKESHLNIFLVSLKLCISAWDVPPVGSNIRGIIMIILFLRWNLVGRVLILNGGMSMYVCSS